jgi:AcrR family transcriptional regulator
MASEPRERILATATRLFSDDGIHAVGMDRIITEADVGPMTVYRHFGGKDTLVAATLERWSAQWLRWLGDQVDRCGDDPDARFAGLWDALEGWVATEDFRGSFVANAAIELRSQPAHPAHRVIAAHRVKLRRLLEEVSARAGAQHPDGLAAQLQALLDGATAAAVVDRRPEGAGNVRQLATAALSAAAG